LWWVLLLSLRLLLFLQSLGLLRRRLLLSLLLSL
jgi:hypothetical protein